ncbi:MAG: ribonuclease III [bacterium]|nr:ribonuclease III [bacterium]
MPFRSKKAVLPPARRKELLAFSRRIDYSPRNLALLDQALTHSSTRNEIGHRIPDNQRLEYLGDSVLGLIVNEALYDRHPDFAEGELARIKSAVVSESSLAPVGAELGIGPVLTMGRGEESSGGAERSSNLADAFEALIAAIYLDRGLPAARKFVLQSLAGVLESFEDPGAARDSKSVLQELVQKHTRKRPVYEIVSEAGPDHERVFECRVLIDGREAGRGRGASRKRAEQLAASNALETMNADRPTGR